MASNPFHFWQVQLLCSNLDEAKILKKHSTPPKLIFLNFVTNPMVDLKRKFVLIKSPKACS
jgi:hypothetical protein